ncbi:MAG: hypothetical protein FJ146_09555 [Deltaproteobacteria bacterium]|nr:hypothetical protein [Deltaproteobacteria bacterium]
MRLYGPDKDKFTSSLVVSSQAAAERDIQNWLTENQQDAAIDGDGWTWRIAVSVNQAPDPSDTRRMEWHLKIQLCTLMTAADLVEGGILSSEGDARMLSLIGEEAVPMAMKPTRHKVASEAAARTVLSESLPSLKRTFAGYQLHAIKRALVHRWVDQSLAFGGRDSKFG